MSLPGIEIHGLGCVAFVPQGRYLIAAGGKMLGRGPRLTSVREIIAWNLPDCDVRWHVVEEADSRIAHLAVHPEGKEFITHCTGREANMWDAGSGEPRRTVPVDVGGRDVVYSADGQTFIAPASHKLTIRHSSSGEISAQFVLDDNVFTSAQTVAYLPGTDKVVVGCQVIGTKGNITGLLFLVNLGSGEIERRTPVESEPQGIAVAPDGRWLCVIGRRKNRGYVLFWDPVEWKQVAGGGAHGGGIYEVRAYPDGTLVATCGADNVIRLWSTETWKTVVKLEEHACEGSGSSGIAWSPDGQYLAYANAAGPPPRGGVFLYQRGDSNRQWQLTDACRAPGAVAVEPRLRHILILGSEGEMDSYGNYDLPVNPLPEKCPHCTFPDIDAIPQPYLLRRGVSAPTDFATAQLGNFFVRESLRQVLELAVPDACNFYPTVHYRTDETTDWFLAVPQTQVQTTKLPDTTERCPVCNEPKDTRGSEDVEYEPPDVDIFKSQQWTGSCPGKQKQLEQWRRIDLSRELWFSVRLVLLFQELGVKGFPYYRLELRRTTEAESSWIAAQAAKVQAARAEDEPAAGKSVARKRPPAEPDVKKWLTGYLKDNAVKRPLAAAATVRAWSKKHGIELPKDYERFVTTVGRKRFRNLLGLEGLDVRIVGPKGLDCESYRRDPPEEATDEPEPDGLLFAVAVSGDCLCFDLRGPGPEYPVVYFDHEINAFTPYAPNFAATVHRLASGE